MGASLKRRDYRKYVWKRGERMRTGLEAVGIVLFLSYFFYRSVWAVLFLAVVGAGYISMTIKQKQEKCKWELVMQFRECMLSVSTALEAGYAVENAFLESRSEMKMMYGEQSLIYQELELIRRGLAINITLEELLGDLAGRSACEEIDQFAQIFAIAKRSGGNISEIMHFSIGLIGQKIDVRRENRIMISGRRMEQNIMKIMPFCILLYVGITYTGYFDGLYHNWQGVMIMTICLILYLTAYIWGDKILQNIEKNC